MENINIPDKNIIAELKNLVLMQKQNKEIFKKIKHVDEIYNETINSLIIQLDDKKKEIDKINKNFLENSKHLKHIISILSPLN